MRHCILLLLCSTVFFLSNSFAQQTETFNAAKDAKDIRGYTIRLLPAPTGGFGFTVSKEKSVLWFQENNPFLPGNQRGFLHKDDAYKLAEWIISEREKNSYSRIILSAELAKQLNISDRLSK